jgi:hypothetical protein
MQYQDFYTNFLKGIYPTELSRESKNSIFLSSCKNGNLEVAQWLWSISNGDIDIHADNEWVFKECCKKGLLKIVTWLWNISDYSIDLHASNKLAFINSLLCNKIKTLQFLIEISRDNPFDINGISKNVLKIDNKLVIDNYPIILSRQDKYTSDQYLENCNQTAKDNIIDYLDKNEIFLR